MTTGHGRRSARHPQRLGLRNRLVVPKRDPTVAFSTEEPFVNGPLPFVDHCHVTGVAQHWFLDLARAASGPSAHRSETPSPDTSRDTAPAALACRPSWSQQGGSSLGRTGPRASCSRGRARSSSWPRAPLNKSPVEEIDGVESPRIGGERGGKVLAPRCGISREAGEGGRRL